MEVRRLNDEDLVRVAELYLASYGVKWSVEGASAYLEKFYRFEPERALVSVEGDGRISGAALGYSFERESGVVLYIQELMVHPDFRNKGYGKVLVQKLRDSLIKSASRVAIKPLVKADTTVLNFYNSLGFERDRVVSFSYDIE